MFFVAGAAPRWPCMCAQASAISFPLRRAGSSAASGWLATPEGKKHVFPLKSIDTLRLIRHLHVSRGAGGGKKSGLKSNVQRRNRDGEEKGEGQEA
jgi:hypothetical protein